MDSINNVLALTAFTNARNLIILRKRADMAWGYWQTYLNDVGFAMEESIILRANMIIDNHRGQT